MDIELLKELIEKREEIDEQILAAAGCKPKERKTVKCSNCGVDGHTARTCKVPAAAM